MSRILDAFTAENLTFIKYFYVESSSDWKDGDWYCKFIQKGTKKAFDFRKTKTMVAANFIKGLTYTVKTDNMGNPKYVVGNEREVIKYGGRIISHDIKTDKYFDESKGIEVDKNYKPLSGEKLTDGNRNYLTAALNKLIKGTLTLDQLTKYNKKGMYFSIRYVKPKDRRMNGNTSYGFAVASVMKNSIYLESDSKDDANYLLKLITGRFDKEIVKRFEVEIKIYSRDKK